MDRVSLKETKRGRHHNRAVGNRICATGSGSFATFAAICCASSLVIAWRRIVDPAPNPKKVEEGRPHTTFAIATSDAFFERRELRAQGSQLALIDGDHSFAEALHDFENLEALAASNSIIAIHDVVPDDIRSADSEWWIEDKGFQRSGEATVYRFYVALHESASGTKRTSRPW